MCTAVSYKTKDHYFGRNLDLYYSYNESVAVTPRNYPFEFRKLPRMDTHYAMIGMATVSQNYPLYYEATNEAGLSMAGLNFPGNADYKSYDADKDNVTPFEFIPWILGQCSDLSDAEDLVSRVNLLNENFSTKLPLSPLHWIISDRNRSLTVESVTDGLRIYDNPVGVLTNNPSFDFQMLNLQNYMGVSSAAPVNRFSDKLKFEPYSLGMGGIGLPGDLSSSSRFVRAAFTLLNSVSGETEEESVSQFFHILGSVAQQNGCTAVDGGRYEYTLYSSCCNTDKGVYYYTTYNNSRITAVDMNRENLDGTDIVTYPLQIKPQILWQN